MTTCLSSVTSVSNPIAWCVAVTVTGMVAYYRPRIAVITAAGAAILTTPYIFFAASVVNRWQRFAQVCIQIVYHVSPLEALCLPL